MKATKASSNDGGKITKQGFLPVLSIISNYQLIIKQLGSPLSFII